MILDKRILYICALSGELSFIINNFIIARMTCGFPIYGLKSGTMTFANDPQVNLEGNHIFGINKCLLFFFLAAAKGLYDSEILTIIFLYRLFEYKTTTYHVI